MSHNDDPQTKPQARRVARPVPAVLPAVILADVSSSMEERDEGSPRHEFLSPRRIDRLAKVLDYLLTRVRVRSLICFNDLPVEIALAGKIVLPEPAGGTNLHGALEYIAGLAPRPEKLFVITDGMPNNTELALEWAKLLRPMAIDAYYVGPEGFSVALDFMQALARAGGPGGRSGSFDMIDPVLLGQELQRRLLAGPDREQH